MLGCFSRSIAKVYSQQVKELYYHTLFCAVETGSGILPPVLFISPQQGCGETGNGAVEGYNAVRSLQNIYCKKGLEDLLNLGKQRLRGHLTATYLYLEGSYKDDRPVLGKAT